MTSLIFNLYDFYNYYLYEKADPRTSDWPLIRSPLQLLLLLVGYNVLVLKIGPLWMKNRKPYDVKSFMIIYNLAQVIFNAYFFVESLRLVWLVGKYNWFCEEVDYSCEPFPLKVAGMVWLFMWTKVLDLLDTVFMVLRKKTDQISFLHVYHHTAMVLAVWIATRYVAGGHCVFFGTVNSFVHVIMYFYYFLTAIKPEFKKNIWWKRHITEIQLIQFVVTLAHGTVALLNTRCNFPKPLLALFLPQDVFMFALFWDFYNKAYLTSKSKMQKHEQDSKKVLQKEEKHFIPEKLD